MGRRGHAFGRHAALWLSFGLAACGGNVPVTRGFESRQVLSVRDATLKLSYARDVVGSDPQVVYTAQPEGATTPVQWSLDVASGALRNLDLDPPPTNGGPSGARYVCGANDMLPDGTMTVQVTDTTTSSVTDIKGVTSFAGCVRDDGTFSLFRRDSATTRQVLWTGPYQQMAPVTLPFDVQQVVSYGTDTSGQITTATALGASPSETAGAGVYTIDLGSRTAVEVIPATPASTAWAAGAPQAGSLQSTTVSADVAIFQFKGHYIYSRKMSDGGTTLFAGPFSSGPASELALFQLSAGTAAPAFSWLSISSADDAIGRGGTVPITAFQLDGMNGAPSQLVVWDSTTFEVTVCPSSPDAFEDGVISPDGLHALFRPLQLTNLATFSPLQLLTLDPNQPHTCVQLQDYAEWGDFSGDGSKIAWITKTQVGEDTDLWTANSDGTGATMILSGPLLAAGFVAGTTHLEMSYQGDLVWLDVANPDHFSYVAEQLFGFATGIGSSWFVAGYNYSNQDATGLLGVVNLDSGQKLPISPAVSQYKVVPQTEPADGGAAFGQTRTGVFDVVYVVRGRNPSPQDGIWLATVRPADLP
ncbi:MAG TPA: hypothetical protein VHM31_14485 [Polyangia bacterium]|nr:hypothetical protein [Polyangia bacterium]